MTQTTKPRRRLFRFSLRTLLVVLLSVGMRWFAALLSHPSSQPGRMSDFAALWNTTDALQHYVATTKQWPRDWDALSASLASVDPAYSDGDISFAKDRVEINFGVEIGSPPRASGWCVRLKSGRVKNPPAEQVAFRLSPRGA